ncbi:MAG TPA: hypothetical protein GX700_12605, partial [Paracoccus sp.]|nr:hypothetical protein [Paracoccus sp. (in: a-proteobacteria)]
MHPFSTRPGARFFCRTDFTDTPVLNLNFFDAAREKILFHLSLRHDEGVAVVNRRDAAGWRREQIWRMSFARAGAPVELVFQGGAVRVSVEGRELGRFDRLPRPAAEGRLYMRRGFPRLNAIAHVDVHGDCADLDLGPMPALPPLALTDRLEVLHPGAGAGAVLMVEGQEAPLPVSPLPLPYGPGAMVLRAVLPGRIWLGAGEVVALRLVDAGGGELAGTSLTRAEVGARISALARAGALRHDTLAALQAVEHCRHGDLLSLLDAEGRAGVAAAAERFGLSAWLFDSAGPDSTADVTPAPPETSSDPNDAVANLAYDQFTALMRRSPQADPIGLLRSMQRESPLPAPGRRALMLRLAEWFCAHADPRPLHALALEEGLERLGPGDSPWHDSAVLPFLYLDSRPERVSKILQRLAAPGPEWIITPTIGWVARQAALALPAAGDHRLDDRARFDLVWQFLTLIESRAAHYWDRTPCLSLIGAVVELLVQAEAFPRAIHDRIVAVALRAYGLSPAFWDMLAVRRSTDWPDPPRRIVEMQMQFEGLAALIRSPAPDTETLTAIEAGIAAFERLGCVDAARFRRELLGPAGVALAPDAALDPDTLLTTALDPEEAALRYLAFPHAAPTSPGPALQEAAARGLPAAYERVPRAPNARLQARLARQAVALLEGQGDLAAFAQALAPVARAQSRFLGFGLGMAVATGLARQGRDSDELMDQLATLRAALTPAERDALAQAVAPTMALHALRRALPEGPFRTRAEALFGAGALPLPADDRAADLTARANPLFDTLVAVYSCQPNLDTRI